MRNARFVIGCLAVVVAIACIGASPAPAPNTEDPAKTTRFEAFFGDILAGRGPTEGLSVEMKQGLTPELISEIDATVAPFGKFQKLAFVSEDSVQGYDRYHYTAIFEDGKPNYLFVLDSTGNIAGFFRDE
ncbi:MAG TPA: hypothetical protein VFE36_16875 [Candidatus Baltobacteraceae bacterium]|jgi:hypothetical protein|nr:hypothetical protein [Candidatus Baltobacteraceae bacterium]